MNLLFPPKCPLCGRVVERAGLCASCSWTLPRLQEGESPWTLSEGIRCAAPFYYEETVRGGILRLKFQGASGAAEVLGGLLAECAADQFSGEFDAVTWVPVGRQRLRKRGYDQARLLAEAACRCWRTRPVHLLKKTADNSAQSGLKDAAQRRANVLGVYEALPGAAGRRILLVDDVCTTGSTLRECAQTLLAAGARSVCCVTLARTRKRPGEARQKSFDFDTENV